MDFKSALLRGLVRREYLNSIVVAPQGRSTKVHVRDPSKRFKVVTNDRSSKRKLFQGNVKKVERSLARPNQQQKQDKKGFEVKEFPIEVSEIITYKEGKPYKKVTIEKVKEEKQCKGYTRNKRQKDKLTTKNKCRKDKKEIGHKGDVPKTTGKCEDRKKLNEGEIQELKERLKFYIAFLQS